VDRHGIPLSWAIDGVDRHGIRLLAPTIDAIATNGWLDEIDTLHLDRGYDYPKIRRHLIAAGLEDHVIQRRRQPGDHRPKSITLGLRWILEATNSWLSNYGHYAERMLMPRGEPRGCAELVIRSRRSGTGRHNRHG
jgi:hypothetical protein